MGKIRMPMDSDPLASSSSSEEDSDASEIEKESKPQKSKPAPDKPLKSKPAPESSEEIEASSEEEETDDEDQSKPVTVVKKTTIVPDPATTEASTESSTESESGSNEDSVADSMTPSTSAFTIKPTPKPKMDSKQHDLKTTQMKATGKRPLIGKESKAKKSKVVNKEDEEFEDPKADEKKSGGGKRLWCEKDEIAILDGLILYRSERGSEADLSLFPEYLKSSIRANVSKVQLNAKLRRLRKKYVPYLGKSENGEDPVFPRTRDSVLFNLSKKIWDSAGNLITTTSDHENVVTNNTTADETEEPKEKRVKEEEKELGLPKEKQANKEVTESGFVYLGLEEIYKFPNMSAEESKMYFEKNLSLIGGSKGKEMNEKWKKLLIEEFEVYAKKIALMSEMSNALLDAFKASKN